MRISDWSSDVCSSDLCGIRRAINQHARLVVRAVGWRYLPVAVTVERRIVDVRIRVAGEKIFMPLVTDVRKRKGRAGDEWNVETRYVLDDGAGIDDWQSGVGGI